MVKIYHLRSCHAKLSKKNKSYVFFYVNIDFFKLKKKVLLTYLVKVLTFGQTVDFLIKMLTFLTYAKMREVMGQNWNKNA